jgi:peptide deformylase
MDYRLGVHESLIQTSTVWDFSNDGDATVLEQDMIKFMLMNNGIGLAANQIGLTKRVFVMGSNVIPKFPKPFAVFNPVIIETSTDVTADKEGCLSYPGLFLTIKRPEHIRVEYQNSGGDTITADMDGYVARCFLHEYDHLNGTCFVDIVSPLKLQLAMKKLRKKNK